MSVISVGSHNPYSIEKVYILVYTPYQVVSGKSRVALEKICIAFGCEFICNNLENDQVYLGLSLSSHTTWVNDYFIVALTSFLVFKTKIGNTAKVQTAGASFSAFAVSVPS